jgi:ABC-type glycerol-3-phosphate transport system substrate-binding protein
VHHFLSDRAGVADARYADIPTRDGKPLTIGRGWALAVVTRDPSQQAMALRLIEWLLAPDNNAIWNQATASIPTRYATFKQLAAGDSYYGFLQHLMEVAVPPPAFLEYDQISRILQQSLTEVLRGEASPEQAAAAAVDAIVR